MSDSPSNMNAVSSGPVVDGTMLEPETQSIWPNVATEPVISRRTSGNDNIVGTGQDEQFDAGDGDDVIFGGGGSDIINGQGGTDTAVYTGPQGGYTVTISPDAVRIADRTPGRDGTDVLTGIEQLRFDGDGTAAPFNLDQFDGGAQLDPQTYELIIELYIAYFDRAPDALGLNFWANAFADGTSLNEMATLFTTQPETQQAYPDGTSSLEFATVVYNNVLGRTPDQAGLNFWVNQLESGSVSRQSFILEVLAGAKAPPPTGAAQDFINQQIADRAYLETKTDIGAYYAVHLGMSNANQARDVMDLFTGQASTELNARNQADVYYAEAFTPDSGVFLMPVLGVLNDNFNPESIM